jgi:hypothetical protein
MEHDADREKTVTIRFKPGSTPISGVLSTADRETQFTGWIELAGLIESLHPEGSRGDEQLRDRGRRASTTPRRP